MKQLTTIFTILTALLLATSCSKEELPGGESTDEPGLPQTYTFTVSPDLTMEGDAETRSQGTQEEMPTRCFMQVYDALGSTAVTQLLTGQNNNGSFTFTVALTPNSEYTYLFYADNGNANITELTNITYPTTGQVVAYAHKQVAQPEQITSVNLKHIVTKITIVNTGTAFTIADGNTFTINYPCASTYNVLQNASSSNGNRPYTLDGGTAISSNNEVCTFYAIAPSNTSGESNIILSYRWCDIAVPVTLTPNSHVTLRSDLSPNNQSWNTDNDINLTKYYFFQDEDTPKGTWDEENLVYCCYATRETMNEICKAFTGQNLAYQMITHNLNGSNQTISFIDVGSLCNITLTNWSGWMVYKFIVSYQDTSYPPLL